MQVTTVAKVVMIIVMGVVMIIVMGLVLIIVMGVVMVIVMAIPLWIKSYANGHVHMGDDKGSPDFKTELTDNGVCILQCLSQSGRQILRLN